jgi:hypothetical protein
MNQHIGVGKGIESKVAGPIAGIAAHEHLKAGLCQFSGYPCRLPLQPFRELESDLMHSPLV